MINVDFYTFSKRKNSTKKPTGTAHTVAVSFKETTDLENPTIEVHDATIGSYNYAYIGYTGRYYFVSRRRSIAKDTFEIDLVEDYLASAIDSIRGQNVYCAMSSVAFNNILDDPRVVPIPLTFTPQTAQLSGFNLFYKNAQTGEVIARPVSSVFSEEGIFQGLDIVYAWRSVRPDNNYVANCAKPSFYKDVKDALDGGDPLDYVGEVWTTPFKPDQCHNVSDDTVTIAGDTYDVSRLLDMESKRHSEQIIVPTPQHGDFRFNERFVKYYLMLPLVGVVNIPTELVRQSSHLMTISYSGNVVTGELNYTATLGGVNLGFFSTTLKGKLPMKSQNSVSAHAAVGGITGAFAGAGTGMALGGVWGAVGGALAGGVMGAVKEAVKTPELGRTVSNIDAMGICALLPDLSVPTVLMIEHESDIDPATLTPFGRPCEKVVTVSNGYMQTRNASFSFAGTDNEIDQVNRAFDTGVYVE